MMEKTNSIRGTRSLTRDFSLGFLIVIVLISIVVFTISSLIFNRIEGDKFKKEAALAYNNFKELIITPLWHYNELEIASICRTFLSGNIASKIVLFSEDEKTLYSQPVIDEDSLATFYTDDLVYDGKRIGRVVFHLKPPGYSEHTRFFFYTTLSAITIICISIALATWWLLRLYVNRPLKELLDWMFRIEKGDYTQVEANFPQNEIQSVVNRFSKMVDSIRERENNIRESEKRYRTLFESANDTILIMKDDVFIDCNQKAIEMFGCEREQIIGKAPHEFSPELQLDGSASTVQEWEKISAAKGGTPQFFEWRHVRSDGTPFDTEVGLNPIEISGELYLQAITRDITKRKKAEETIKQSEDFLNTIIENIPDMIFVKDAKDLRFVRLNKAGEELLGHSREDLIGKCDYDFFRKEETDFSTGRDKEVLDSGKFMVIDEEPIQTRYKGERILHTKKIPILHEDGRPKYLLGISEDITERKRLEKEHKRLQGQLQQSQRLEAIGTLAGGIAHDFNNILSAIIGNAEIASIHELPEEHPAQHSIQQVIKASGRAGSLVNQILAFSRQSKEEATRISVTPIINEVTKLLRATLPSTIEIHLDLKTEKDTILGEPTGIHQVLMNLCTNAAHYMMKDGGVLSIRTRTSELDSATMPAHWELKSGNYLEIIVEDTGLGMSSQLMERIFEPYFRTKQKGEGTGLGLSVVHGIVSDLNGAITVDSTPKKGSRFRVWLPVVPASSLLVWEGPTSLEQGTETILFVDDEEQLTDMGKRMLQKLGYTVHTENSSTEALETFRKDPGRFDVVITDMTMPNMTGDLLAIEMMKIRSDVPIILCTGFSASLNEEQAKEIGIREFIYKPLVVSDLSGKIRRVLGD